MKKLKLSLEKHENTIEVTSKQIKNIESDSKNKLKDLEHKTEFEKLGKALEELENSQQVNEQLQSQKQQLDEKEKRRLDLEKIHVEILALKERLSKIILAPLTILKKSICIGSSVIGFQIISFGKTFSDFPSIFIESIFDKKFSFSVKVLNIFFDIEIFWFFSFPP